jgi:hypothetical protein
MNEKKLLTNSSVSSFKKCRKRYDYEYNYGIRGKVDGKALRIGTAGHNALEAWKQEEKIEAAIDNIEWTYATYDMPQDEFLFEMQTVKCLIVGYGWRWQDAPLKILATEQKFQIHICNPATGFGSKSYDLAGKIDGIVELQDGRLAVQEHKFLSESIDADSDLWQRMQIDQQITIYVIAARQLGFDVATVLYDVIRKPTIKPTPVPVLDENGMKIVLDVQGNRPMTARGQFYQAGNSEKGLTLQLREMTVDEWGKKLLADIYERPDFYYVRKELPRLDSDLEEFKTELWDTQKTVSEAWNKDRFYRTVDFNTCPYCPFMSLCLSKWKTNDPLPEGFKIVEIVHQELVGD